MSILLEVNRIRADKPAWVFADDAQDMRTHRGTG